MAMMSNEGEKKCPLCAEEMDWTDQQLKPCKCGYEVCVWCWHHIMDMAEKEETEGRCPACRSPYDKEKIVGMEAKCEMLAAKKDRENKPQKPKPKKQEERKDLANVRVIQRKMAYVIGLPLTLADEDLLQRKDYFGQYGKVCKVSLSRTAGGAIQQFVNDTCSVYITYSKEEEAIRCIQSVHGFVLEGKSLRASFGTAKYCHAWLKNVACNNPACLYLHSIGADEDSFGKDEEAAVHTRNRVHQIVGATHNMQQKSGTTLPPPLDNPLNGSSITTDKFSSHSVKKELNSNGALACSVSSKDQDGRIKTPNRSFVDVVARTNSGPEHGNITEDRKLLNSCSDFSSVITDQNFSQPEYIDAMPSRVSSISRLTVPVADKESQHYTVKPYRGPESHLQIAVQDKDTQHYMSNPFRDPSKFSVLGMADYTKQQSCFVSSSSHGNLGEGLFHSGDQVSVLAATFPVKFSDCSIDHAQHRKEISGARDIYADCRNVNNYPNEVSVPFGGVNSASANRFVEARSQSNYSNSFSNGEIVGQLRRLDGDNITNNSDSSALDAVESSIISSILSMDFDSCDDSSTVPHSLAELYAGSSGRHGAFRNSIKSDQSRFSFAKEDSCPKEASDFNSSFSYIDQSKKYSLFTDQIGKNSMEKENYCMCGPQNQGSRTSLTPPGFSVPSRDPPPGDYPVNTLSFPCNQYCTSSNGNIRSACEFDFNDPAIMVVRGGNLMNEVHSSGLGSWPTSTPQLTTYDDEARLLLLMQQESRFSANDRTKFCLTGNNFGVNNSRMMEQNQTYNPSSFAQLSQQRYGNGRMSNGYWSSLDEIRQKGELGIQEAQRNDRLGFDKCLSGHRDIIFQMSSTGDAYNRIYGL